MSDPAQLSIHNSELGPTARTKSRGYLLEPLDGNLISALQMKEFISKTLIVKSTLRSRLQHFFSQAFLGDDKLFL